MVGKYKFWTAGSFYLVGGGVEGEAGYTGCLERIQVDNRLTSALDWHDLHREGLVVVPKRSSVGENVELVAQEHQ